MLWHGAPVFITGSAGFSIHCHSFIAMKPKTASGCTITYAPFWLVWLPPNDGGPERYPHLRVTRPWSGNGTPLTESEALQYWLHSRINHCTATAEAEECLAMLRDC
jgi:hypothetical protein